MTVQKLIALLRKMPPRTMVAVCNHDQDPEQGEFDGTPHGVAEAPDALKARGYGVVISL